MLEYESVFKNQVFELHRFYRVQKNMMDGMRKREQYEDRTRYETSSTSNALPSQMTPYDAHRQNSSRFYFANSVCSAPPVSNPEFIRSSPGDICKEKGVYDAGISFKNCTSPKNSESRPTKLRKMIDLELPADMYVDIDEVEQCQNRMTFDTENKLFPSQHEKTMYLETRSESDPCVRKPYALADLNEPPEAEETTADTCVDVVGVHTQDILTKVPNSWKSQHWSLNQSQSSSCYSYKSKNWLSPALKAERNKDNGRAINQTKHPEVPYRPVQAVFENHERCRIFPPHLVKEDSFLAKTNINSTMYERSNSLSSFSNTGTPQPSYACSSNLANSWKLSSEKSGNHLSQKAMSVQLIPFLDSKSLSKSSQSSAQGNGFHGIWYRNAIPRSTSSFQSETPVHNGFYHGSPSDRYKELPAHFAKAGIDYGSGSSNDNATSGSFPKTISPPDLNSKMDLDLNVVPYDLSNENSVSVLPWLRDSASDSETVRSRNSPDKPKCDARELCNRYEVSNTIDHQSCLTSSSSHIDSTRGKEKVISGKKELPFDINVPFEEFDNNAETDEVILVERREKHGFWNMFDLNSCITEDEIPSRITIANSSTMTNSIKKPDRCIIDLEAPPDVEAEEEGCSVPDEESMLKIVREAADAIVALSSSSAPKNHIEAVVMPEKAAASGDVLSWFASVICSSPVDDKSDCLSNESDSFEEMNLKLMECSVEEYFPNPPKFEFLGVEEAAAAGPTIVMGQTRRTRRGRQKRDFQRDILPGLTSLSRHEITEDVQTFGGLMRATGYIWNCGGRKSNSRNGSGRGRKRKQVQVCTSSPPPPQCPSNGEVVAVVEDRSLTSWGKTTRRPRRQRCAPSSR